MFFLLLIYFLIQSVQCTVCYITDTIIAAPGGAACAPTENGYTYNLLSG